MGTYTDDVRYACASLGYTCNVLNRDETLELRTSVEAKYAELGEIPLWMRFCDHSSIFDPDGWDKIREFTQGEVISVFFDTDRDDQAVRLADGAQLSEILQECPLFVFYVTNENQDYLLGFNDHDFLLGAGTAKAFIQKLRESRSSE